MRHEKTTPPMTMGRQHHLAIDGDLPYMMVLTRAEKTGSPALTIWPKVTEPALRARTDDECAAAEQKATGSIAT